MILGQLLTYATKFFWKNLRHELVTFFFAEISSFLLFATKRDVRRLSLDSTELADVVISLSNVSSAIGVEYDSDTDSIFWSDLDADIIGHASWNGSHEKVSKVMISIILLYHVFFRQNVIQVLVSDQTLKLNHNKIFTDDVLKLIIIARRKKNRI